ncbi:MAG: hypothetical protein ICV72_07335 [Aldersonia sp.]|nr:hypothetical protein [Aldersonia sp.]
MADERPDPPSLDDVIEPTEAAPRDRREHGKAPERLDDDYLEYRTEQERISAGIEDYDPDHVPPATE